MTGEQDCFSIAIVGGGPRATYTLERLSAEIRHVNSDIPFHVHIYEQTGEFGAGRIHSPEQSKTNILNRTCRQVSFAADESVIGVGNLRPQSQRPRLDEWCEKHFTQEETIEFGLGPDQWPQRRVNGLALREMFQTYIAELTSYPNVKVFLHPELVTDIRPDYQGRLAIDSTQGCHCNADSILLVTGHPFVDPDKRAKTYTQNTNGLGSKYVQLTYPFEKTLNHENCGSDHVVGVDGMGLTAIDFILYLTEGRGGLFEEEGEAFKYLPSGSEPSKLIAFSESGMFPLARPENFKERGANVLEHKGVFFTHDAVDRLRSRVFRVTEKTIGSTSSSIRTSEHGQLNFRNDLMPLVQLEMAYVHYTTLFGPSVTTVLIESTTPVYQSFLTSNDHEDSNAWTAKLIQPIEDCVDEISQCLDQIIHGHSNLDESSAGENRFDIIPTLKHWSTIVFGNEVADSVMAALAIEKLPEQYEQLTQTSPWLLDVSPGGNRFNFDALTNPVRGATYESPAEYMSLRLEHMYRDLRWAKQGNVQNPHKAATDGVWRDLRGVLNYAVDNAGLTVESYAHFVRRYRRLNNKLSNGPGAIVIKKLCALVEAGKLEISIGPNPTVECDSETGIIEVTGSTGSCVRLDTLIDARVPSFHAGRNAGDLYKNLLKHDLARLWTGVGADGINFVPGFLDLTDDFHPINQHGEPINQITILGPAATICNFFQFSLLRPNRNHVVMREIAGWLTQTLDSYSQKSKKVLFNK